MWECLGGAPSHPRALAPSPLTITTDYLNTPFNTQWTTTTFYPWPGYVLDWPYRENAAPWSGFNKVVKGELKVLNLKIYTSKYL